MVQEQSNTQEGEVAQRDLDDDTVTAAIKERRLWLHRHLVNAAGRFGVELLGDVVNTYDMRSAGSRAWDGERIVWLRVVLDDPEYQPACRWEGNVEANAIMGVPKPQVLRWVDWHDDSPYRGGGCRLRGEVMTLIDATAVSDDGILREDPALSESWWHRLGAALAALAAHSAPVEDPVGTVDYTIRSTHYHFDVELDAAAVSSGLMWATSHADLHWGNLTRPVLFILDWETWRLTPAGYDVATLYCNSLLHPPTAYRLRAQFEEVMTSPSGQFALLFAACRYLWLTEENSDFQALNQPLREVGRAAIERITS